jgi:multidrug efflux pump subunit AcrB
VIVLEPWDERTTPQTQMRGLCGRVASSTRSRRRHPAVPAAADPGLGNAGGFALQLQALGGQSPQELTQVLKGYLTTANQDPRVADAYSTFSADTPRLYLDLDRTKAQYLDVPVSGVQYHAVGLRQHLCEQLHLSGAHLPGQSAGEKDARSMASDIGSTYVRSNNGPWCRSRWSPISVTSSGRIWSSVTTSS